jgi:hypothetical protein
MKIKVWVATGKVGSNCESTIEVDANDWHEMCEEEQEELCQQAMFEMIEWGWGSSGDNS